MLVSADIMARLEALYRASFGAAPGAGAVAAQAPGRLELAGNHTDHQGGCVIAAALNRHIYGLAVPNGLPRIQARLEGFDRVDLDLSAADALLPHPEEAGTSAALIRGMAAAFAQTANNPAPAGAAGAGGPAGFNLVTCSDLPAGAGVSSSAAFEMLLGVIVRALAGQTALTDDDRITMALQGMHVEQDFFDKSCGAQDQMTSAFGGAVHMDFGSATPAVTRLDAAAVQTVFGAFAPVLVDSRVDHSRYTADYQSVPADMFAAARAVGCARLGDLTPTEFFARAGETGETDSATLSQRALKRARHFYEENARVAAQYAALQAGDAAAFLEAAAQSGRSNREILCNAVPTCPAADDSAAGRPQEIMDLCARALGGPAGQPTCASAPVRIHGGGFGGCVLAFVPRAAVPDFVQEINDRLGYDACLVADICPEGAGAEPLLDAGAEAAPLTESAAPADPDPGCIAWTGSSPWGTLELTINLRKPEKDPRDIAAAAASPAGTAAPCALCTEAAAFNPAAELARDSRLTCAVFALPGDDNSNPGATEDWMLHFSPYGYYPLHCIALPAAHRPMRIDAACLARLLACTDRLPFYFMGSNADLPLVGGSILSHDDFQGGGHVFPLMKAPVAATVNLPAHPDVTCGIVRWPASTLRLTCENADHLLAAATDITDAWRAFRCDACRIVPETDGVPHNTVTPIAYLASFVTGEDDNAGATAATPRRYVLDLVLRNNRTTEDRPFGLFHPDESLHHIKKENIGLIEIMGRAILPARLVREIPGVADDPAVQAQVSAAFAEILKSTGVFKDTPEGASGWQQFVQHFGGKMA